MPEIDRGELNTRVEQILNRRPAVGLALGVVRNGSPELFHGHGMADLATKTPVTEDTVFRVASITKTFTAIAVMQLCEQGLVDLDAPANGYLRGYELVPADRGWRPATLRHLMTHTAGIGEEVPGGGMLRRDFGETVKAGQRVPFLADFYRGHLRLEAEPGTRFRYTDHGPATLGQVIEDVTGVRLERYLRENIFEPLGMADTTLVRSELDRSRVAIGYKLTSRGAKAVADRDWVTIGASNACSTPRDMARYLAALMNGGTNEHGSVLKPDSLAAMFAPQYQPDPRIPGLGLAFFRGEAGGHPTVGHQGLVAGFDSVISVAPDDGLGVMAFTNGTRAGATWLPTEVSQLVHHLLGVPPDVVRTDVPQRPDVWADICGWYYLPGSLADVRIRSLVGAGFEVFVRGGRLTMRFLTPVPALYRGFELHPVDKDDPYAFMLDFFDFGLGGFPVVFSRDPETGSTALHLAWMPLSAERQPETTNPRRWVQGAAGVGGSALLGRMLRAKGRQGSG